MNTKESGFHLKLYILFSVTGVHVLSQYNRPSYDKETSVESPAGTIIGYINEVEVFNQPYKVARFLGIPYAESPTGELRFQKPVAKKPFLAPLVAKQHGLACLQPKSDFLDGQEVETGENCLNLNIYRPEGCSGEKLAVMVWFHGGGFVTGLV